ncbi:hypothetical protein D9M73_101670 [compost metagenome]
MPITILSIELKREAISDLLVTGDDAAVLPPAALQGFRWIVVLSVGSLASDDRGSVTKVIGDHEPAVAPAFAGDDIILLPEIATVRRTADPCRQRRAIIVFSKDDVRHATYGIRAVKSG